MMQAINGVQFRCDYCKCDLTNKKRIKCCTCKNFDLCLDCFYSGVELFPHEQDHPYQIIDEDMNFPLFSPNWSASDEILLLESLSMVGIGNWTEVGKYVGKAPDVCRDHYFETYIETETGFLPELQKSLVPELQHLRYHMQTEAESNANLGQENQETEQNTDVINVTALPPSPLPFTTADKMQLDFSHPSAVQLDRNNIWRIERGRESYSLDIFDSTPPHFGSWVIPGAAEKFPNKPLKLSGTERTFNNNRHEFEEEWEDDAEKKVKEMAFDQEDTPEVREIKFRALESYNMKLKWRHRRREFVLQNDLLDPRKKQKTENKDLFSKTKLKWMRALLQLGPKEQREIVDTMTELEKARNLVRQYQEYRKRGLRFIAEVQKIEDDIKHHRTADSLKTKRNKILKRRQETPLYENEYYEFLSDQERNFCSKEGILPKAFLTAKEQVIVATAVGQQIETPLSDDWPGTVESWRRFINFLQSPRDFKNEKNVK